MPGSVPVQVLQPMEWVPQLAASVVQAVAVGVEPAVARFDKVGLCSP